MLVKDADVAGHSADGFVANEGAYQPAEGLSVNERVAVEGYHYGACACEKAGKKCVSFSTVFRHFYCFDSVGKFISGPFNPPPGIIDAAIVYGDNLKLVRWVVALSNASQGVEDLFSFVVGGDDHGAGRQMFVIAGGQRGISHNEQGSPGKDEEVENNQELADKKLNG